MLPDIIHENQGAFMKERFIAENILLCLELIRGYGKDYIKLRMC